MLKYWGISHSAEEARDGRVDRIAVGFDVRLAYA